MNVTPPKFCSGQLVGVYNSGNTRTIYIVDQLEWNGTTWVYTFMMPNTKEPAMITFGSGARGRYKQEERWLAPV